MQLPQVTEVKGINVLTTRQIAEMYGTTKDVISYNFNYNKKRYTEGKHYIALQGDELRAFKASREIQGNLKYARILYLWTEKGALLHAKSLNTKKAWEAYEYLVDFYFRVQEEKIPAETKPIPKETGHLKRISFGKGKVVDIPENKEAQEMIVNMRKYLVGMDALLDVYSMYLKEDDFNHITHAISEMISKISWAGMRLYKIKPQLVEKFL